MRTRPAPPIVDTANLRRVVAGASLTAAAVQAATATIALRRRRRDYADAAWGPGMAAVAVTAAALGNGDARRRWALAAVTTAWSTRLAGLMVSRLRGSGQEDERYTEFLDDDSTPTVVAKVFVTQGLAQLLVTAPVQLAAASRLPSTTRRWLVPLGLLTMVTGASVEALADRQKAAHAARADADKPEVLDTGLWGWSRHPNYFGDSLVWDGAWVTAAASPAGGWTLGSPLLMTYLLVHATGARRTERRMEEKPAYRDYQRRVAFFLPRPPRSR